MSYYVSMVDSKFFMKGSNKNDALDALKASFYKIYSETKNRWYLDAWKNSRTFEQAMRAMGYEVEKNRIGDYVEIEYELEYYSPDEESYLEVIAPFVEAGSYLEFCGEDGAIWRLVFDGTTVKTVEPKISW